MTNSGICIEPKCLDWKCMRAKSAWNETVSQWMVAALVMLLACCTMSFHVNKLLAGWVRGWLGSRLVAGLRNNLMSVNRVVISDAWRTCQQIYSHATIVHERCTFRLELHRFVLFLQLVCLQPIKIASAPPQIGNHSPGTLRSMRKLFFNKSTTNRTNGVKPYQLSYSMQWLLGCDTQCSNSSTNLYDNWQSVVTPYTLMLQLR